MKELSIEEKAKAYDEAKTRMRRAFNSNRCTIDFMWDIFPEFKGESEDERIRKAISQCVEDMRGQFEKLYGVHHKDAIAWIEKQGEPAKLSEEEQNRFTKGVLKSCALSFINYLDAHKYEGKMCVSNGECKDIENAFHNAMWDRLHRYYCKYVEKQTNIKNTKAKVFAENCKDLTKAKDFSENREDLSEFFKQVCHMAASLVNKEHDYTMETIEWYAYRLLECAKKELEKQGEQKPTDKVEPKFKVGDWIIRCAEGFKHNTYRVIEVNDYYVCEALDGRQVTFTFNDVHQNFRLWNISDAKDGDVLVASDDSIFLFAGIDDCVCKYYVALTFDNYTKINREGEGGTWEMTSAVHPATKKQRDLLMKEIYITGYTFDFEKKELKKIEENPVDKVEPKFKVGDWITFYGGKSFKILKIEAEQNGTLNYLLLGQNGHDSYYNKKYVDQNARLWTIEDAKDGDVLTVDNIIVIYKRTLASHIVSYCKLINGVFESTVDARTCCEGNPYIHPSTKEQRGLLFAKMEEAGYKWNAEKKELKKVEENLDDKVEPKFKVGDWIINHNVIYHIDKISGVYVTLSTIDGTALVYHISVLDSEYTCLWTLQDAKEGDVLDANGAPFIYKKHNKDYVYCYGGVNLSGDFIEAKEFDTWNNNYKVYPATKEQRDLLFAKMKEAGYEWDVEKKELKKVEQNLWSEEDKRKLNRIYSLLGEAADAYAFSTSCRLIGDKECIELQDFLKSIVRQNTWKPSDEQMIALRQVISGCSYDVEPLLELETKLKNLKFNENNSI